MDINVGSAKLGSLQLLLHDDTVPKTVLNFCKLLQRSRGDGYKGSSFHRIIKGFMAQGGDFTNGDGTGGESIYGKSFRDENFILGHDTRGILSMANSGPHTNGSQFFMCFRSTPHLDGKHVVFGRVNLADEESARVLDCIEKTQTNSQNDRPIAPVTIVECGLVQDKNTVAAVVVPPETITQDDGEIDLEDEDNNDNDNDDPARHQENDSQEEIPSKTVSEVAEHHDAAEEDLPKQQQQQQQDEEKVEDQKPKTKSQLLKERLRKLKMKNNQARQLNRQEVLKEGERLGSEEGMVKERRRQAMQDKKAKQKEWASRNAKALETGAKSGIDGKFLVEQASDSLKSATRRAEKEERSRHDVRDYHNSEGQHRNYERSLHSLPAEGTLRREDDATSTFDPLRANMGPGNEIEQQAERDGARRLAHELKRRIDKQSKKKRNRLDFEATDVSYINERNKRFNEKIGRNFDEHTAEIRQNLERGTAL